MKKLLLVVLACTLCVCFSACVAEEKPSKEDGTTTTAAAQTDNTFLLNETAVFTDLKITARQIKESSGKDFFEPKAGNIFVGVEFTIENVSDEEIAISSLLQFEGYVDDVKSDYSVSAACCFDEGTLDGSVAAGKKLVGWYALEVPKNWEKIEVNFIPSLFSSNPAVFMFQA